MHITLEEKEEIRRLYHDEELSYKAIADKFGVSKGRIYQIIKKYKMKS